MSFKSLKNIQQSGKASHKNSHTNNMDEIPGTSSVITENNFTFKSKSNELIDILLLKLRR